MTYTPAEKTEEQQHPTSTPKGDINPSQKRTTERINRGLFPFLVLISTPVNAKDANRDVKYVLTLIVSLAGMAAPLGSTILMPVLKDIARYFHTTPAVVNLSVAFYSLAVAFTPLWWSYFSEQYGRRAIYLTSFFMLAIFNIVGALSVNISMFIAMRILAGGACASVQAVGAGTIADLWEVKERGKAIGIFFLGPMLGPLIAPIIGGAVSIKWGWRSTQWVMVIYGFLVFILVLFLLPETSNTTIRRKHGNKETNDQTKFQNRQFQPSSMCALGAILGSFCGGRWTDYIMQREAKKAGRVDENGNLLFIPQDRIRENVWNAVLVYPAALVWFGWVADKHVFWFVLCLPTFFYGLGMMVVSNVMTTMLTEFVPKRSSTGVAVNNLLRNTLACAAIIVADPLINAIGTGWLLTIAAIICWLSSLALIPMKRKADKWSKEMAEKLPKLSL